MFCHVIESSSGGGRSDLALKCSPCRNAVCVCVHSSSVNIRSPQTVDLFRAGLSDIQRPLECAFVRNGFAGPLNAICMWLHK